MSANPSARPVSTRRSFLTAGTTAAAIGAPALARSFTVKDMRDPVVSLGLKLVQLRAER